MPNVLLVPVDLPNLLNESLAVLRQAVTNCRRWAGAVHDGNLMFGDGRNIS